MMKRSAGIVILTVFAAAMAMAQETQARQPPLAPLAPLGARAAKRVRVPDAIGQKAQFLSANALEDAFIAANPGLDGGGVAIACRSTARAVPAGEHRNPSDK